MKNNIVMHFKALDNVFVIKKGDYLFDDILPCEYIVVIDNHKVHLENVQTLWEFLHYTFQKNWDKFTKKNLKYNLYTNAEMYYFQKQKDKAYYDVLDYCRKNGAYIGKEKVRLAKQINELNEFLNG